MEQEHRLIGDIYDAAVNSELWPRVTAGLAEVCGGERIMLATTDVLQPDGNFQFTHNIAAELIQVWREQGFDALEVELHRSWTDAVGVGIPTSSDDHFGGPEGFRAAAGPFYDMLASGGVRRQMVVAFDRSRYHLAGVGLNNYAPFPAHSAPTLQRLSPHLRRAVEVHRQLAAVKRENQHLYRMLDLLDLGVVLVDVGERVRYANPKARRVLQQHGGIRVRNSSLLPRELGPARRLQELLRGAIRTSQRDTATSAGGVMGIRATAEGQSLTLSVVPLSSLAAYQDLAHDQVAAAVFLSQAQDRHQLPLPALQELYQLTRREAEACQAFLDNGELSGMAADLGVRLSTARSMIKTIYQKTGQDSQARLMRLLMEARLNFRHLS